MSDTIPNTTVTEEVTQQDTPGGSAPESQLRRRASIPSIYLVFSSIEQKEMRREEGIYNPIIVSLSPLPSSSLTSSS
jgi:hypothetical protein